MELRREVVAWSVAGVTALGVFVVVAAVHGPPTHPQSTSESSPITPYVIPSVTLTHMPLAPPPSAPVNITDSPVPAEDDGSSGGGGPVYVPHPHIPHPHVYACVGRHIRVCI